MKRVLGPWQPLLGAKGWDCTGIVASRTLAHPAPGVAVGRGISYEGVQKSGSCFYQCTETIGLKLPGSLN